MKIRKIQLGPSSRALLPVSPRPFACILSHGARSRQRWDSREHIQECCSVTLRGETDLCAASSRSTAHCVSGADLTTNPKMQGKVVARGHPRGFALPIDLTGMAVCRAADGFKSLSAAGRRVRPPRHQSFA